jgi:hypothetical protein
MKYKDRVNALFYPFFFKERTFIIIRMKYFSFGSFTAAIAVTAV